MSLSTTIQGVSLDDATIKNVHVTSNGELAVNSLTYSEPHYVELGVDDQIYNCVDAKNGKRFIIVGILIGADRNVTTDCSVHIYESLTVDGTTDRDILTIDLNKGEHTYMNLINLSTKEARYINATTDDDDVDLTVFGYYVPA
jgi:hypothetical protein